MAIRRADDITYTLLSNGSATGAAVQIKGGEYLFTAEGTPSGGTISLQIQTPNGAWTDVQVFTGSIVKFTTLPANQAMISLPACNVRCACTGGTPTGIYAFLIGCG